jgi:hypothetical protein
MFCIGANKYHGCLYSQTTRDISLTLVDGTHSCFLKDAPPPPWLICGIVSQFCTKPCVLETGWSRRNPAPGANISGTDQMMCCLRRANMSRWRNGKLWGQAADADKYALGHIRG